MTEYTWRAAAGHWRLERPLTRDEIAMPNYYSRSTAGFKGALIPVGGGKGGWSVTRRNSMDPIRLPADLTLDEALDAAKLILLAGERT